MSHELVHKYRPKRFTDVIGQEKATKPLLDLVKRRRVPHFILLTGPSGVGKTTIARILATKLGSGKGNFIELDAASHRSIDDIRNKIQKGINRAALGGGVRTYYLDEAHKLTNDAQNSLLKDLEEPPKHVYFIMATTHPGKLIPTIRNRAMVFGLTLVKESLIRKLLLHIIDKEKKIGICEEAIDKIISLCRGCPRVAIHQLEKIIDMGEHDDCDQINVIQEVDVEEEAVNLCRQILFEVKPNWKKVGALLSKLLEEGNEEGLRHLILNYCTKVVLGGGKFAKRAYMMIQCCRDPFYDCGKSGLVASCFEMCQP